MKIFFIGQLGLPPLGEKREHGVERRAWALAREYAARGHEAVYCGTEGFLPGRSGLYQGVFLKKVFSLNPEKPGGLFYILLCFLSARRLQPDIIQLQGWTAVKLSWLLKRLIPAAQAVVIIDQLPPYSLGAKQARRLRDSFYLVTVPSRELQYKLLIWYGIHAHYVPDGFKLSPLPDVSLGRWNLKQKKYVVLLSDSVKEARQVIKQIGGKTKIVFFQPEKQQWKRLKNDFPRVVCVGALTGRSRQSILNGASRVILADESTDSAHLLATMAAAVPIVAIPAARYQEILGATARFSRLEDLKSALRENAAVVTKRAKASARRARQHFTWERNAADYLQLVAPNRVVVPVDSVKPALTAEWQRRVSWA